MESNNTDLSRFIVAMGITMTATKISERTNWGGCPSGDAWPPGATHWTVTLNCGQRKFTTEFSQGSAYTDAPDIETVLDCLRTDCDATQYDTFEEWAQDLGYDTDSRRAERIYTRCLEVGHGLEHLFYGRETLEFFAGLEPL